MQQLTTTTYLLATLNNIWQRYATSVRACKNRTGSVQCLIYLTEREGVNHDRYGRRILHCRGGGSQIEGVTRYYPSTSQTEKARGIQSQWRVAYCARRLTSISGVTQECCPAGITRSRGKVESRATQPFPIEEKALRNGLDGLLLHVHSVTSMAEIQVRAVVACPCVLFLLPERSRACPHNKAALRWSDTRGLLTKPTDKHFLCFSV